MAFNPVKEWVEEVSGKYKASPEMVEEIFWTAFRALLNKERRRHKRDIIQIILDDNLLAKRVPLIPVDDAWIEVPK